MVKYFPKKTARTGKKLYRKKRTYKRSNVGKLALRLFETKQQEYRESETLINTLSNWYANGSCMILTQNATYSTMIGHSVRGRGILFRGWVKNNATTTVLVRMGVALIKRGSSKSTDFYNGTDVLEGNTGNQNITTATSAQRITQRFNKDQYRVIRQMIIKLGNNSSTDGSDVRQYKYWIPLNGKLFRYDGSGVLPSNDLYAVFLCPVLGNSDESTGENIEHSFTSTFYYVDP